jgi:hypothetical protein
MPTGISQPTLSKFTLPITMSQYVRTYPAICFSKVTEYYRAGQTEVRKSTEYFNNFTSVSTF